MPSPPTSRYRRSDGIIKREVGTDILLFDPRTDALHVLNPSGAFVWDQLTESRTQDELEQSLRTQFDVEATAPVGRDVERVLSELCDRGLVLEDG